ncbi:MAG: phosphoglycolate phosphatase [Dethiosulfovibrio peptidovorans]|nr:MAG: phosphoglycolate phosphatase [Dethiosulfovibrio peptidovorans]
MAAVPQWHPLKSSGFIFDWDGVLARTNLDFSKIYAKYFDGRFVEILAEMPLLAPEKQRSLSQDIRDLEMAAAAQATAVRGCMDVLHILADRSIPWAVVSRNCREAMELAARSMGFTLPDATFHRDSGPVKPDPEALWMASRSIGADPAGCVVVGDFVYDLLGARRAGMRGLLVEHPAAKWDHWADARFDRMLDLAACLERDAPLIPWEYHAVVREKGNSWLSASWALSVCLPSPLSAEGLSLALKLAALGVGRFTASPEPLPLAAWHSIGWLDAANLDQPQFQVLDSVLRRRFPLVFVEAWDGKGIPLASFGNDLVRGMEARFV